MRTAIWIIALALLAVPVRAQDKKPAPKPLLETWQAGYYEGVKVGHVHTVAVEIDKDGKKFIRTTRTTDLVLKRYGSVMPIKSIQTSDETADGKVLSLGLTYSLAKDKEVKFKGEVKGKQIVFSTSLDDDSRRLPFPADAVGYYYQESVFARKKVKTGDKIKLTSYELLLPAAVHMEAVVKDSESVDRLVGKKDGKELKIVREPAKLLRVDVTSEKLMIGEQEVQLPPKAVWLDAKLMPVRERFEVPGMGPVTLYSTTKEAALKEGVAPELLPDLGLNVTIRLQQTIEKPYETTEAVYRITTTEPLDKVFVGDERQKVGEAKNNRFDLTVKAVRQPGKAGSDEKPGDQYLASNQFIDSNNAQVKVLAKKAVGDETDAWKKAQKIEKWVHDNMKVSTSTGFPTAAQIAKDLEGDCRQHALLTAAMCRAAGVSSRTAVGLIYVRDEGRSPTFGFHMWTEVWVGGKWLGLDAILGKGGIGATHLKMGQHSWAKTVTLAPLLPISRTLGKLKIEVISAK